MSENACGTCSMCCKLMGIQELKKPVNQWCQFVKPGCGCGIYEERPPSCREFVCGWLASPGTDIAMRPDKSKVMIVAYEGSSINAMVDPAYPTAWREPKMQAVLVNMADAGYDVIVGTPGSTKKILIKKVNHVVTMRTVEMTETDPETGRQELVV